MARPFEPGTEGDAEEPRRDADVDFGSRLEFYTFQPDRLADALRIPGKGRDGHHWNRWLQWHRRGRWALARRANSLQHKCNSKVGGGFGARNVAVYACISLSD